MSLRYENLMEKGHHLGIWKIEEDEDFFLDRLRLQPEEHKEFSRIKGRRRLEWLASRYLVHILLSDEPEWDRIPVLKDEFGKPHLYGSPLHLSFSHSHEYVAVILSPVLTGIDIQRFVARIGTIAHKFMRPEERESLTGQTELAHLHFYWNAKEALFKAYGRKELDWKEHIQVDPFEYRDAIRTTGRVIKNGILQEYDIYFEKKGEYYLGFCLEKTIGGPYPT